MRDDPRARARRVELGRRLRELRQERGLTQAELARAARMGQATLSNYEKGRRDIPSGFLVSVAGALGLSIGEALDVDHILIVRGQRLREAVSILVRTPDVLDSIVGPRPPPPPRPRRAAARVQDADDGGESADAEDEASADGGESAEGEQDGDDGGESADAEDEASGADDESAEGEDEASEAEDESADAEDGASDADDENADAEDEASDADDKSAEGEQDGDDGEGSDADDPGGPARSDTGAQA